MNTSDSALHFDGAVRDPDVAGAGRASRQETIQRLKERDNTTNLWYLARDYAIILGTIAIALWSFSVVEVAGLGWWWDVPIAVLAVIVLGAAQHNLGGCIHEGTHYTLMADRKKSELVSDWFAAFPIYTSTHAFRLHHLAHHQFVNDPERDPNFDQARDSGHWLDFPIAHIDFLVAIFKQLNPVRLVSYIAARARYSAIGVDTNPYADPQRRGSPWVIRAGVLFAVGAPAVVMTCIHFEQRILGMVLLAAMFAAVTGYYLTRREEDFSHSRITPVISHRSTQIGRVVFLGVLYGALTVGEWATGAPTWGYFGLFWILPLFTTFPLFMILREWLQHGNADRGRYTNSRIFLTNPLFAYAIFPWGMDYHLPHHIVASVPHYKLKDLHALLSEEPEYARQALVVEGWSHRGEAGHPTIIDVLGPGYTPQGNPVHVDDETLELADINDRAGIDAHVKASRSAG